MNRRQAIQRAALISGIALTPAVLTVIESCQSAPTLDWTPQFLTKDQAILVGKIANRILPPTETLGALDVGVDRFIDLMLKDMFSEADRLAFTRKLDDFSLSDVGFINDTTEVQDEKITLLEQTYAKARKADPNTPKSFWRTIKELTLLGYFTSEAVMIEQLNYHAVPGEYRADIPLAEDTRLYVDNNV